jgi:pyruvate,water dikinase
MPDVATPMTWSMIQRLLFPVIRSVFRLVGADVSKAPAAGLVAGRTYFNANTGLAAVRPFWGLMRRIPNFAQALGGGHATDYYRRLLDIPDSDLPDLGFRWPKYLLSVPRILRDLIRHSPRRGDAWTARIRAHTAELVRVDPEAMSTLELADFFERLFESQFEGWDLLFLATQSAALPLFQKACCDWLDDPNLTLGYRLFAGLGGIPEVEAGLALWRLAMVANADTGTEATLRSDEPWRLLQARLAQTCHGSRFLEAWSAFMLEHGHHCRGELELFNARWAETPDYILGMVRGYLDAVDRFDPLENQQRLAAERVLLTEQCQRRLRNPIKRRFFSASLRRAQKLAVNREVWKDQAVRVIVLLRRILLVLGRRLCEQGVLSRHDDIFFLEVAEVHLAATGKAGFDLRNRIRQRRLEYESNQKLSPPPIVVGKYRPGETVAPTAGSERAAILEGIPVSPGIVTGHVRVILRANDHEQILPGEILVAPFTDPAWTLYFVTASGVIMEQGGILSHGSIVAREFGLPAVTNVEAATRLFHTGDWVHLDGNSGRVTILDRATTAAPAVRQDLTRFPS